MRRAGTWGLAALAFAVWAPLAVHAADRPRAVLELFTSQGCSSCPPADRNLSRIADQPGIIALTLPVDYWDYLGWRDTLARPAHAKRQKAYSYVRGDRQVYTPQVIINGAAHAIGSDWPAVERGMTQTGSQSGVLTVPVSMSVSGDTLSITVAAQHNGLVSAENPATVTLFGVSAQEPVEITRGENRGQTVMYRNVVRSNYALGEWTGEARTFVVSIRERVAAGCQRAVVLVQAGSYRRPGPIVGATMAQILPGM